MPGCPARGSRPRGVCSPLWHASRRWSLEPSPRAKPWRAPSSPSCPTAGVNGAPTTALGLFREARALGWCDADGGAAVAAMWIHDGAGWSKPPTRSGPNSTNARAAATSTSPPYAAPPASTVGGQEGSRDARARTPPATELER